METKRYTFGVLAALTIEYKAGEVKSKVVECVSNLMVDPDFNPPDLDLTKYHDKNGIPTQAGCETITRVLLGALASNIKAMHQAKYMSAPEHYAHIIKEVKKQTESITGITISNIKKLGEE